MIGLRLPRELPAWQDIVATPSHLQWFPLAFDRQDPDHAAAMDALVQTEHVVHVHDTIDAQVADLLRSRSPSSNFSPEDSAARVAGHVGPVGMHDYGRWVFFPWSRRLVHLLPPDEFTELRSDRNRNKVTKAEQALLRRLKIALAGLSVGNAIAVTLALEGVFGELRLADFDTLDLSNMNRIRCGVHEIGLNKAVISARQIFEQNPYANLVLYTDGVTAENLGEFLDGDGESGRVDVVIDECDNLFIKIKLREEARDRRLPVLMETSDRGMLDVERFDLEPTRPVLHGMLGTLTSADIPTLPPAARLHLILQIIGESTISPRLAASLLEFGHTLRGLSQLGSDVTLGGATTTAAVRRFGLGQPLASGRIFVDVSELLADLRSPNAQNPDHERLDRDREIAELRSLVEQATLAPSDGNAQPWRFVYRGNNSLEVFHDPRHTGGTDDPAGRHTAWIGIGAAIENLVLSASAAGKAAAVALFPDATPDLIARVQVSASTDVTRDPLHEQIGLRMTNRAAGTRTSLTPVHAQVLNSAARAGSARLQLASERETIDELGRLFGEADRLRLLSPTLHAEFVRQIRWDPTQAAQTRDGLTPELLASGPADLVTLTLLRDQKVAKLLRDVHGGNGLTFGAVQQVASAAAIGYLTIKGTNPEDYVRGGRAMQQVWLTATALGLAFHPCTTLLSLFARVELYQGAGLDRRESRTILDLRERFLQCFNVSLGDAEILLFRLSYARPTALRAPRRNVDDVFTIDVQDPPSTALPRM